MGWDEYLHRHSKNLDRNVGKTLIACYHHRVILRLGFTQDVNDIQESTMLRSPQADSNAVHLHAPQGSQLLKLSSLELVCDRIDRSNLQVRE